MTGKNEGSEVTQAEVNRMSAVVEGLDRWLKDCAYARDDVVAGPESLARLWDLRATYQQGGSDA